MNAEIISVGTELLLGDIENTNTTFLSKRLAELGISVYYHSSVGDNTQRLIELLSTAVSRSQIIVITGGLGPTEDDLTKETVCKALGIELRLDDAVLERIEEYFSRTGRQMTENNKKQAIVPEGATVFQNDHGTAPGLALTAGEQVLIMLPGPPSEMRPMFDDYVAPYLSKYSDGIIFSRTVKFFGIGESQLAEKINPLFEGENPTVAPYAKRGEVQVRVTAKSKDKKSAGKLCEPIVDELRSVVGGYIYGYDDETLEGAVVKGLLDKKLHVATAESCTAGLLSKRITDIPSSSNVFSMGVTTYSNEMKTELLGVEAEIIEEHGAVSAQVAREMAERVRQKSGAEIGVGITGIAGPDGGTQEKPVGLVYIAVADENNTWVKKNIFGHGSDERDYIRHMASSTALNLLRLYIVLDGKLPGAGSDDITEELDNLLADWKEPEKKTNFIKGLIPWKGDPVSEIIRKCVFLLSSFVLIGCLLFFANHFYSREKSRQMNSSLIALIPSDTEPNEKEEGSIILKKYQKLYEGNNDTIGRIRIPGIETNNVVMKGKDNDYYLNHKYDGSTLAEGELFVDTNNIITLEYQSQNITIYGHNRHDGQMFGQLNRYRTDVKPSGATTYGVDHYNQNNLIYFDTIYEEAVYKIFAVMFINTKAEHDSGITPFEYRQQNFGSDIEFLEFVNQVRRRSFINTPVDVTADDHIINLSTCAYDIPEARLVIFARKVRPGESTNIDTSLVSVNKNVLLPQLMYDKYPNRYGTAKPVFNNEAFFTNIPSVSSEIVSGIVDPNSASSIVPEPSQVTSIESRPSSSSSAPPPSQAASSSSSTPSSSSSSMQSSSSGSIPSVSSSVPSTSSGSSSGMPDTSSSSIPSSSSEDNSSNTGSTSDPDTSQPEDTSSDSSTSHETSEPSQPSE